MAKQQRSASDSVGSNPLVQQGKDVGGTTTGPPTVQPVAIVGYKLTRPDCGGWCFAGTTPEEVGETIRNELGGNEGLSAEECGEIQIVAYDTTQEEIDKLPEFQGW